MIFPNTYRTIGNKKTKLICRTKKNLYHFRDFRGTNYFCMPSFSRNTDANKELKSIRMQSVAPKGQNEITDIFPKRFFSWKRL